MTASAVVSVLKGLQPPMRVRDQGDLLNPGRSLCLLVVSVLFLTIQAHSLDPSRHISQYAHSIWRAQDGPVGETAVMTQTRDGYIWVAIPGGLVHFDGVRFVPWIPPKSFPVRHYTAMLGSTDGSLWIGTSSGLGQLQGGHFRSYSKSDERWGIYSILEDHAGNIWVTRYRLRKGEGALCEVVGHGLRCYGPAEGVPLKYALDLKEDSFGNFWIASDALCRWRPGESCTLYFSGRSVRTMWLPCLQGLPE